MLLLHLAWLHFFILILGGIKAITYIDAFQMFIYLSSAILILCYLINMIDFQSLSSYHLEKTSIINLGFKNGFK